MYKVVIDFHFPLALWPTISLERKTDFKITVKANVSDIKAIKKGTMLNQSDLLIF